MIANWYESDCVTGPFLVPSPGGGRRPRLARLLAGFVVCAALLAAALPVPARAQRGTPAAGAVAIAGPVPVSGPVTIGLSFDAGPQKPAVVIVGPDGPVPGSVTYHRETGSAYFTPVVPFLPHTIYKAGLNGQDSSASFTTGPDWLVRPPDAVIPKTLFGMHIHRPSGPGRWPSVPVPAWRLWDTDVTWRDLEPARGKWYFGTLDDRIRLGRARNAGILMVLGKTPAWASARPAEPSPQNQPGALAEPKEMEDWRNYVRTVAARYKGRITAYEVWNEASIKEFFTGSIDQMVAMAGEAYRILKEVDLDITVLSPSATEAAGVRWLERYLSRGGNRFCDAIGYHFYVFPEPPEAMVPVIRNVRRVMKEQGVEEKPLWNTELGWSKPKVFSGDGEGAAYVARSYIVNWASGVDRLYWYAWDNNNWVTLRMTEGSDNRVVSAAGVAYGELQKWLVGASVASCGSGAEGVWVVTITREGGYRARIVWRPAGRTVLEIPAGWRVTRARDLRGGLKKLAGSAIEIGGAPVLLE